MGSIAIDNEPMYKKYVWNFRDELTVSVPNSEALVGPTQAYFMDKTLVIEQSGTTITQQGWSTPLIMMAITHKMQSILPPAGLPVGNQYGIVVELAGNTDPTFISQVNASTYGFPGATLFPEIGGGTDWYGISRSLPTLDGELAFMILTQTLSKFYIKPCISWEHFIGPPFTDQVSIDVSLKEFNLTLGVCEIDGFNIYWE